MLADEILENLSNQISPEEYQSYIKQLKFNEKASDDNLIVFTAPNELMAKFINTRYSDKIAHLYEVRTGIKPNIEVTATQRTKITKQSQVNVNQIKTQSSILNPSYTFENFVCGASNQYAFLSAKAAAEKPGVLYNPLFIYGGPRTSEKHILCTYFNQ